MQIKTHYRNNADTASLSGKNPTPLTPIVAIWYS